MTLEYRKGDLFSVTEGIIAHGCNAQGAMGSGVAGIIRSSYRSAYKFYLHKYHTEGLKLAEVQIVKIEDSPKLYIANLITQEFYGKSDKRYVSYDAVDECFANLMARNLRGLTINIPKIGAGLGGGDWNVIEAIIKSNIENYTDQNVVVWEL